MYPLMPHTVETQKKPGKTELSELSNSGGGIRTPDTRIMIPLL